MTTIKKLTITLIIFFASNLGIHAQALKVGYINTQELITAMPDVKAANDSLMAAKVKLDKKIENMVNELRQKAMTLEQRKNEIAPVMYEKEVSLLKAEEKKIMEFEQLGQQELSIKQEGLLAPIQNKINTAIKEVASENGYTYIIDSAQGWLLYADSSVNIVEKVKAKILK